MPHTPGPWTTVDAEWLMSQRTGMGFRYFPVRATDQTWDIATVFADEDDSEMLANVRLIAAAPALLDALRELVHYDEGSSEQGAYGYEVLSRCKAVLATAEGRE
jgi:hypothetical protein